MAISTAIDPSAVARALGIKTEYKQIGAANARSLPQRIAVFAQGNTANTYATTKRQVFSAGEVAAVEGFGSPAHLSVLQLLPTNGDGVAPIPVTLYPLADGTTEAAGDLTLSTPPTVDEVFQVRIGGVETLPFTILSTDTGTTAVAKVIAAVNAVLEMPAIAGDGTTLTTITAKWKGTTGNDIAISVIAPANATAVWAVTDMSSGATNPTVDAALAQVGNVWESMALNALGTGDALAVTAFEAFGVGRWDAAVRKPLVVFSGDVNASVATATTVPEANKTHFTNAQLVAPGSDELPFVVAARELARIAAVANSNPPLDYGSQKATGLKPGTDGEQWTDAQRNTAIKAGSSTVEVVDGVVEIGDVVTFYHPTGDPLPAYRYVVDIVRLQTVLFNLDAIFGSAEWAAAPLIPDDQATTNPSAKKPKMAVAAAAAMVDSLALEAIVSDPETSKALIVAGINPTNPKRLDLVVPIFLSGNTNIKSIDLQFAFFFGTAPVVGG